MRAYACVDMSAPCLQRQSWGRTHVQSTHNKQIAKSKKHSNINKSITMHTASINRGGGPTLSTLKLCMLNFHVLHYAKFAAQFLRCALRNLRPLARGEILCRHHTCRRLVLLLLYFILRIRMCTTTNYANVCVYTHVCVCKQVRMRAGATKEYEYIQICLYFYVLSQRSPQAATRNAYASQTVANTTQQATGEHVKDPENVNLRTCVLVTLFINVCSSCLLRKSTPKTDLSPRP